MASSSHLPYKTKKIPQFLLHLTKLPLGRQFEKKYDVYLAKIHILADHECCEI
jgi:hypothetical protein